MCPFSVVYKITCLNGNGTDKCKLCLKIQFFYLCNISTTAKTEKNKYGCLKARIFPLLQTQQELWAQKILAESGLSKSAFAKRCRVSRVIYMGALTYVIGSLKVMGSKGNTDETKYYRAN